MKKKLLSLFSLSFLFLFTSCFGILSEKETGICIILPGGNNSRTLDQDSESIYYFTINCENISDKTLVTESGKTGDTILFDDLITGHYILSGEAFSDEKKTVLEYKGSVEAEVVIGEITNVTLILKYVGSDKTEITAKKMMTSYMKDYFKELTVNFTGSDGKTVEKSLKELIDDDFKIEFGDETVTKENYETKRYEIPVQMANLVPVKIKKNETVYVEYTAKIGFEGLEIGCITGDNNLIPLSEYVSAEEELQGATLKLVPMLNVAYGFNEEFNEPLYFYSDLSDEENRIKFYEENGNYKNVLFSDLISVNWTLLVNNVQAGSSNNMTFKVSDIENFSEILAFPLKIAVQASGDYLSEYKEFVFEVPSSGATDPVLTITPANKQTVFMKNYFKELTVNYSDVDGTTTVKTLTDLLNEDYEIDIGDSHVTKETTAAEQFMIYTGMANLVPVKISKDGDIYTEYSAEIIFDGLKIGYIHDECEISVMNDDDYSRIALLKPSMKLIPLLSVNSEFDGENMDFRFDFSDPEKNFKLFNADGTYITVTGSDIISANWTILFNNVQVGSGNDIAFNFSTIDTALQFPVKIKLQVGGEYLSDSDEFILEATGDSVDYTGVTSFTCTPPGTISFASNYLKSIRPVVTYRGGDGITQSLYQLINDGFEVVVGDTSITASNYDEVFEDLIISYAGFVPFEVKKNGYTVGTFTGSIVFEHLALSASFEDPRHDYVPDILSVDYEFNDDDFTTLKLSPMCKANFGEADRPFNYFDFSQNDITYYENDGTQQILSMSGSGNIVANWTVTFNESSTTKQTSSDPELLFSSFDSLTTILRYPVKITCKLQSSYIPSGFTCVIVIDEDGYVDYE